MLPQRIANACYKVAEQFVPYADVAICGEHFRVPLRWRKWWFQAHESDTMEFVRSYCKPGMVFVDIGAHFGIYSITAARRVAPSGKVVSFEPCWRTREILRRFIAANEVANVELREEAICHTSGTTNFFTSDIPGDPANTLAPFEGHPNQVTIRTLRLDDLELSRCDLLKIDAEGAENRIFQGATAFLRKHRPEIFLSVHPKQIRCSGESLRELWDSFTSLGFIAYVHQHTVTSGWFEARDEWFDVVLIPAKSSS